MSDEAAPAAGLHPRHSRRMKLSEQQLESISRDELVRNWRELDSYVDTLESQASSQEAELVSLRETEERMRQQHLESSHHAKVLMRRLTTKEHEMQEYANQMAELKAAQAPGAAALRSALLDPAVNLLLQRLRQELLTTRARLEETQNELSAWKFTPDSNTGKRLMAKCRLLYQENEELGRMISSGRLAKLEGDLALQKSFSEEVKKSQSELDEFLQDLDEDVEGMQSTIYYLQQELRKSKEMVTVLQQENTLLKNGNASTSENQEGLGDSDVGRESRPRTPALSRNGIQEKGEEDSRGWEERTQGSDHAPTRDPTPSPVRSPVTVAASPPPPPPEEDSVSCDVRTPEHTRPESPQIRTFDESDESTNLHPRSPPPQPEKKETEWKRTDDVRDDTSSDSGELILKLETEDIGEEESDREVLNANAKDQKVESVSDSELKVPDQPKEETLEVEVPSARKRTCPSDDSSDDSDNVPLIKKVRRDSEISLHYNDEEDEPGLTNGETAITNNNNNNNNNGK